MASDSQLFALLLEVLPVPIFLICIIPSISDSSLVSLREGNAGKGMQVSFM